MYKAYLQLKPNVADRTEMDLFEAELRAFGIEKYYIIQHIPNNIWTAVGEGSPASHLLAQEAADSKGTSAPWGYRVLGPPESILNAARESAFVLRGFLLNSASDLPPIDIVINNFAVLELATALAKKRAGSSSPPITFENLLDIIRLRYGADNKATKYYIDLLRSRPVGPLSHDIHYYKAKFFPRLARALLNISKPQVDSSVLDPFSGSGTTLLEATLLGFPSVGIDIDPLSVLISNVKVNFLNISPLDIDKLVQVAEIEASELLSSRSSVANIHLPDWLLKNRKMTPAAIAYITNDIDFLRRVVERSPGDLRHLAMVFASDAITRKVRMRVLGTGSGRFSLSFAKKPTTQLLLRSLLLHKHYAEAAKWSRTAGILPKQLPASLCRVGDARAIPSLGMPVGSVLTSPPYLPSSSGRESYAKHRALSLLTFGSHTPKELDVLIANSVGGGNSPSAIPVPTAVNLSPTEQAIVNWLMNDPLRKEKAVPFKKYFIDLRKVLTSVYEALLPGGSAIFVVGKQSTFYEFSSKKPLLTVPLAEIYADAAASVGFSFVQSIDIRLAKRTRNARPRSLDDYYETALLFKK